MEPIHPLMPGSEQGVLIALVILQVVAFFILANSVPDSVIHAWATDLWSWIKWTKP